MRRQAKTEASPEWRVGVHTSIAGSFDQAAERAHHIGCTTFQIFSSNPRTWKAREPRPAEIEAMARLRQRYNLHPLVIHANYLVNLASADSVLRAKSIEAFREEIGRAAALGAEFLVLHPGSFRNSTAEAGIRTLAASIRTAAQRTPFGPVMLLIENSCGQGNALGGRFEELRDILALLDGVPAGCCLDTAHCYAAGMDISSPAGLAKMIASLKRTVGLGRLKVIHTNDCRSALGSRHDRHEHIGKGGIGIQGFQRIVNSPSLRDKIFILETPLDKPGDDRCNMEIVCALRSNGAQRRKGKIWTRLRRARPGSPELQAPIRARCGKVNR